MSDNTFHILSIILIAMIIINPFERMFWKWIVKKRKKTVNSKYYQTIEVKGTTEPKELTEEEFKRGEQGIVWMDNKTGKLVFKNK